MSSSEGSSVGVTDAPGKKRVWPWNILSVLFIGLSLSISAPDPLLHAVSGVSLTAALGSAYFSLRTRFTWVGLLLLLLAAYAQTFYLVFMFKK